MCNTVQTPIELNTKDIYQLNASDDILSGIILLAVKNRIHHEYPKLLKIPLLNTKYDRVQVPGKPC